MYGARIIVVKDEQTVGKWAADVFEQVISRKPDCLLGLATGTTPLTLYRELVRRYHRQMLDFSGIHTVNLDEYVGMPPENHQSYRYFMEKNLFQQININPKNTHLLNGLAGDAKSECRAYDRLIDELGGIDLQLLGIGQNGHIGFNEPSDNFYLQTHEVTLTEETRRANARLFAEDEIVPSQALTMGCGYIFAARKILLLAIGSGKAKILQRALFGQVTPQVPASLLQLHPDVTIIADEAAGRLLPECATESVS